MLEGLSRYAFSWQYPRLAEAQRKSARSRSNLATATSWNDVENQSSPRANDQPLTDAAVQEWSRNMVDSKWVYSNCLYVGGVPSQRTREWIESQQQTFPWRKDPSILKALGHMETFLKNDKTTDENKNSQQNIQSLKNYIRGRKWGRPLYVTPDKILINFDWLKALLVDNRHHYVDCNGNLTYPIAFTGYDKYKTKLNLVEAPLMPNSIDLQKDRIYHAHRQTADLIIQLFLKEAQRDCEQNWKEVYEQFGKHQFSELVLDIASRKRGDNFIMFGTIALGAIATSVLATPESRFLSILRYGGLIVGALAGMNISKQGLPPIVKKETSTLSWQLPALTVAAQSLSTTMAVGMQFYLMATASKHWSLPILLHILPFALLVESIITQQESEKASLVMLLGLAYACCVGNQLATYDMYTVNANTKNIPQGQTEFSQKLPSPTPAVWAPKVAMNLVMGGVYACLARQNPVKLFGLMHLSGHQDAPMRQPGITKFRLQLGPIPIPLTFSRIDNLHLAQDEVAFLNIKKTLEHNFKPVSTSPIHENVPLLDQAAKREKGGNIATCPFSNLFSAKRKDGLQEVSRVAPTLKKQITCFITNKLPSHSIKMMEELFTKETTNLRGIQTIFANEFAKALYEYIVGNLNNSKNFKPSSDDLTEGLLKGFQVYSNYLLYPSQDKKAVKAVIAWKNYLEDQVFDAIKASSDSQDLVEEYKSYLRQENQFPNLQNYESIKKEVDLMHLTIGLSQIVLAATETSAAGLINLSLRSSHAQQAATQSLRASLVDYCNNTSCNQKDYFLMPNKLPETLDNDIKNKRTEKGGKDLTWEDIKDLATKLIQAFPKFSESSKVFGDFVALSPVAIWARVLNIRGPILVNASGVIIDEKIPGDYLKTLQSNPVFGSAGNIGRSPRSCPGTPDFVLKVLRWIVSGHILTVKKNGDIVSCDDLQLADPKKVFQGDEEDGFGRTLKDVILDIKLESSMQNT